jgi:heme peroxidase
MTQGKTEMTTPVSIRPHGVVRGANLSRNSLLFGGPFGRIFRALPPADFGVNDAASLAALAVLADKMTSVADPADPKDGPDPEEGGIPAAYTYFGQFIDHDLTFDPASSLQKQNDVDALVDYRTPRFDLDNVYGRGPDDQPYLYEDGRSFILGRPLTGAAANPRARDLRRSEVGNPKNPRRAIIGDPRNDENVIISQLQGLLHRFHNKLAADHGDWDFNRVQREVRFHYQWVVLNDFLPTIVSKDVLDQVVPHVSAKSNIRAHKPTLEFYHPRNEAFMPLEFSAAAYRFGHSMVRPGYQLSETIGPLAIFTFNDPLQGLTGFREFPSNWAIDWNLFMDLEPRPPGNDKGPKDPGNKTRTQLAYKIDTSLVNPLGNLPESVAVNPNILALRNLERGWRMRLPTGQSIARAMGLQPLPDDKIIIGKFTGDNADIVGRIDQFGAGFKGNCPLWTYVLAETVETDVTINTTQGARKIKTRKLGPVGGRIVAETFVGLLLTDSSSYLAQNPLWTPSLAVNGVFGLRELIATALKE